MIAMDLETQLIERALVPPRVMVLFSLPPFREPAMVSNRKRKRVRLRKRYNKSRRATLRLVRAMKRGAQPKVWRNLPEHVFAFILGSFPHRRYTPNETSMRPGEKSVVLERGEQIHALLEKQFREGT